MTSFDSRNNPECEATSADLAHPARDAASLDLADQLLALLSTDDAFRARFEADPRAALRDIGYETPAGRLGVSGLDPVMSFSHFEGGLASKETLAAARQSLRKDTDPAIFGPFDWCAG